MRKYFLLGILVLITGMGVYSLYKYNTGIICFINIQNSSAANFEKKDKYRFVDFRVLVNNKVVFNETLPDGLHEDTTISVPLRLGMNTIEVYSDTAKMYDRLSENVFLSQYFYVSFSRDALSIGDYYALNIWE